MHAITRTSVGPRLATAVLVAALAFAVTATGCSTVASIAPAGAKYSAEDLQKAWKAHAESASWDMEVRDVVGQKKSTGSHDAAYTIFLTTFTSKAVPAFKMYGTVDVPNDDSMAFEARANAFFDVIAYKSNFSGVQDTDAFMRFFTEKYPKECFVRLQQETDAEGKSTWKVVSLDAPPTQSTMTELPDSGITLTYDAASKAWSER